MAGCARVVVKYRYLYTILSVLDVLEYLIGENAKVLVLVPKYLVKSSTFQVQWNLSFVFIVDYSITDYSGNSLQQ